MSHVSKKTKKDQIEDIWDMPTERSDNSDDQNTKKLSIREQRTNSRVN